MLVRCDCLGGKKKLYERVMVHTAFYGVETWDMRERERHKFDVRESKCHCGTLELTSFNRVRKEEVKRTVVARNNMSDRLVQKVLT